MDELRKICCLTRNLLYYEWSNKRVIMGFLVGMAVPFWWLKNFLDYAVSRGQPVNVLESFVVVEHSYKSILFLALGWLLIVSDAPFVNGSTFYSLCRTDKRSWNRAMVLYIFVQAALYTAAAALSMAAASAPWGYVGKMWSNPVYLLSRDFQMDLSAAYGIDFQHQEMMGRMNVPQAFLAPALCFFLYLVLMGLILYTFRLLLGGVWGMVITFAVHVGGYELPYLGFWKYALMEYARPANFMDGSGVHLEMPVLVFVLCGAVLVFLENLMIDRVDFKGEAGEET